MPGGRYRILTGGPYNARSNDMLLCDSSGGAFTINLPARTTPGMPVWVKTGSSAAANPITIGRNGGTIMGAAQNMTLDAPNIEVCFVHDGTTWKI